ncbi:MAG: hypothetical protein AB7P97_20310 [Hyphomonadaceae bacterium]
MKWKTDTARWNDIHWRKVFLIVPKRCTDGHTRWLCFAARSARFVGNAPVYIYRPILEKIHHD